MCGRARLCFPPLPVRISWRRDPPQPGVRGFLKRLLGLDKVWPVYTITNDWMCQVFHRVFLIPQGFTCDGASIPKLRIVRAVASLFSLGQVRTLPGGILHDWLYTLPDRRHDHPNLKYEESCLTRRDADELMRIVFGHFGVGVIGRWGAWLMVRVFGKGRYQQATH